MSARLSATPAACIRLSLREPVLRLPLDRGTGTQQMILAENNGFAHTDNFSLVATPGLKPRDLKRVTITGHNGKHLEMRLATAQAA